MENFTELLDEIDEVNDYLCGIYHDLEETVFFGQDKEEKVHVEIKGNFEVSSIKWNEEDFVGQDELLRKKIIEACNDASLSIKQYRQSIITGVIDDKMSI